MAKNRAGGPAVQTTAGPPAQRAAASLTKAGRRQRPAPRTNPLDRHAEPISQLLVAEVANLGTSKVTDDVRERTARNSPTKWEDRPTQNAVQTGLYCVL